MSSRVSRGKDLNVDQCFAATCAYDVGSCRPARFFVAGPSFVLAVETLRRKIERSNLVAHQLARDRRCRRIKYHNAPSTSIGIRCNQFGRSPKAAACKSSLQGIGVWRHRWKSNAAAWSMVRPVYEHSIQVWFSADTRYKWKFEKPFWKTTIIASDANIEVSLTRKI